MVLINFDSIVPELPIYIPGSSGADSKNSTFDTIVSGSSIYYLATQKQHRI
jgi:hypothetical protein